MSDPFIPSLHFFFFFFLEYEGVNELASTRHRLKGTQSALRPGSALILRQSDAARSAVFFFFRKVLREQVPVAKRHLSSCH